jgi:PAS domain S-box-containing protein
MSSAEIQTLTDDLETYQVELQVKGNSIKNKRRKEHLPIGSEGVSDLSSEETLKLIESEQTFLWIFEATNEAIWIIDLKGKILIANHRVSELLGYSLEEVVGKTINDFLIKIQERPIVVKMKKALDNGVNLKCERRLRHKNGSTVYLLVNSSPQLDARGRHIANIDMMANITSHKKAEQALGESQKWFQSLVANTADFIWEVDTNGVYTYCSPQAKELWGYDPEYLLGRTPFDQMLPEDRERSLRAFSTLSESKRSIKRMETSSFNSAGLIITIETSAVPFFDHDGRLCGYRGISHDITKRKKAEKTLQESEEKYRLLVENANEAVMVFQGSSTKFFNNKTLELTGYSKKEFSSVSLEELVHPDDQELVRTIYQKRLRKEKVTSSYEFRIKRKDSNIRWVHVNSVLITWEGRPSSLVLFTDITEKKQAEKDLQESEKQYRLLIKNATEAIAVAQGGFLKLWNSKAAELSGWSDEDFRTKAFFELIHPDDRERVKTIYEKRVLGEDIPSSYEFRIMRSDGSIKYAEIHSTIIDWEGKPAALGLLTDITDRKTSEEALKVIQDDLKKANDQLKAYGQRITQVQEEERKRIAYELHDDTAQYLALIKLELDSLLTSGKIQDPKVVEKLRYLEKDAGRAVDDVRRYSHELRPGVLEHLGLQAALEQIAEDNNKVGQIHVEVRVEGFEPEIPEDIKLGFFRIAQEAISNVRKHAKASLALVKLNSNDHKMIMIVSDKGIGFNPKKTASRLGETGSLGLMSMQERAKLIGADLIIDSKPGYGTTIRVEKLLID